MTESFDQLFNKSLKEININPGSIIRGKVISIDKDMILIDAGLKSESYIPIEQFKNTHGEIEVKIGEEIDVVLDAVEDGFGETILSREKAKKHEIWISLEKAYKNIDTVCGTINGKVKGGFTVELNGIRAFLPGSLVDIKPLKDTNHLEGKELEFKVIKLDKKRNNVVVSRKAVISNNNESERENILKNLKEDIEIKGTVKNLTDYGAFIDLGGVDGLLHITDMSWKRIKYPSEIVNIGDEITVKVLKFDKENTRVSLGLKQLYMDPWTNISKNYPEGTKTKGKVTNLTDYGCFVEIQDGIEGLVHVSEMDWSNKNVNSSKIVNVGDVVEVMILNIDEQRRRISLGIKQCKTNPWKKFSKIYNKGDKINGTIKSITDFGIFIGLDGGIDGLVHLSDISWESETESTANKYKKGEKITTSILQIDVERERISLGIKQLQEDPLNSFSNIHKKGDIIIGNIISIKQNEIKVNISRGVDGILKDIQQMPNNILNIGDKIKVIYSGIDKKNRLVILSNHKIKEKDMQENKTKEKKDIKNNIMAEAFKAAKNE